MTPNIPPERERGRERVSNAWLARMTDKKFNLQAFKAKE